MSEAKLTFEVVKSNDEMNNAFMKVVWRALIILMPLALCAGCSTLAKRNDTGVVVARRAQIRSSTAVVAADLLEVSRGDTLDIIDFQDVQDPLTTAKRSVGYASRPTMKTALKAGSSRAM